jgi:hypothetical protein
MLVFLLLGFAGLCQLSPALAQHRAAGAHEHGRGTLNIAIEGSRVNMELEAPGADIVGFEHAAKTSKQKAAVADARKKLSGPQALFALPAAAGCVLKQAKVEVEGLEHAHGHSHGHAKAKEAKKPEAEDKHSEFHATYAFDCKTPASITTIDFGYFRVFAGAQKLEVNIVTPKGQTKLEATRAKPRIDLVGMM